MGLMQARIEGVPLAPLTDDELIAEEARHRALGRPMMGVVDAPRRVMAGGSPKRRIPDRWTPVHVLDRLEEAYAVLARMPMSIWPKGYKSLMPAYAYSYEDLVGQAETGELERLTRERNHYRVRGATAAEVARMEQALGWAGEYLADVPEVARDLQLAAQWAAAKRDVKKLCQKRKIDRQALLRNKIKGMNIIAVRLVQAAVPVT